jgi:hypothetical protein
MTTTATPPHEAGGAYTGDTCKVIFNAAGDFTHVRHGKVSAHTVAHTVAWHDCSCK